MTSAAILAARNRYTGDAVATASGPNLLVMLYDRLQRDLISAERALGAGDLAESNAQLQHAQQIVLELRTSLDTSVWSGGPALEQLYTWLHSELVLANLDKDVARLSACRELVEPLQDAWRQAVAGLYGS